MLSRRIVRSVRRSIPTDWLTCSSTRAIVRNSKGKPMTDFLLFLLVACIGTFAIVACCI